MCGAGQPYGSRTLNTFFKAMISTNIRNIPLQFKTDKSLFSPRGIDRGTLVMLSVINPGADDYILDLGCG
jgi:16S rRNA (guanine1207-N2)-methyltransferase